ncbi:MAG TPA: xanthine dehydrogenase family protein subunit M [Thermohalobaculum sp.]|nr:xanthine dehydrogenase family protein subunit M [Thermohalobaculum sp.]
MYNFDYVKPGSLAEAVEALKADEAQALGGGQTLLPTIKQRLASPSVLVDLGGCLDRGVHAVRDGDCQVGGGATHAAVAASQHAPKWLRAVAAGIGDPQVRNRGTIGGSLANNDPAADYPAAVLGSGATVTTNARSIAADDFFRGMFETALAEGEIITSVTFPTASTVGHSAVVAANYQKFAQPASLFALAGVFVAKRTDGVRVAVTGASEGGVFRWSAAEAALSGNFSADAVPAAPSADGMIGDLHGSPEYRAHLIAVLTRRAVAACG